MKKDNVKIDIYEPMKHILDEEKDRIYAENILKTFIPKGVKYEKQG